MYLSDRWTCRLKRGKESGAAAADEGSRFSGSTHRFISGMMSSVALVSFKPLNGRSRCERALPNRKSCIQKLEARNKASLCLGPNISLALVAILLVVFRSIIAHFARLVPFVPTAK